MTRVQLVAGSERIMADRCPERTYTAPGRKVSITPNPWQTEDDIAADLARGDELAARLVEDGVESWRSYFRWIGPFKVKVAKEVGPPPWRFPRIGIWPTRDPLCVSIVVGWRSTAFRLFVMWAPQPKDVRRRKATDG